jgi:hypothetical protein
LRDDDAIYQVAYSPHLVVASGAVMDRVFSTTVDRARSRLHPHAPHAGGQQPAPAPPPQRPLPSTGRRDRAPSLHPHDLQAPPRTPDADGVHHRRPRRALRGDRANAKQPGCDRRLDKFAQITARLTGMADRLPSMLDSVKLGYPPAAIRDELPAPSTLGATRTGGLDNNRPRTRAALAATLTLALTAAAFTGAELTTKARATTRQTPQHYNVPHGAHDLRTLRGQQLVIHPGRTRRDHVPELAAPTITALLTRRDTIIAPHSAKIRTPRQGTPPKHRTTIDHDHQTLRRDMTTQLTDLAITTNATAATTTNRRSRLATL